ncbi:MAG: antirestriction protein ArdA [Coriobacteriales bacterium]|jgi:hypothetical protein|nr:antirestriction protein ArdA [Coriobacteriales bacterium]
MEARTIRLYIANLGKYNEGEHVGGWLRLPINDEGLTNFFTERVQIGVPDAFGVPYEEWAIHDFEYGCDSILEAVGYKPGECDSIEALNDLARIWHDVVGDDEGIAEKVGLYTGEMVIHEPDEITNIILQHEEIMDFLYNFDGIESCRNMDAEEKYGHSVAYQEGLTAVLEGFGSQAVSAFDFEKYGYDDWRYGQIALGYSFYIDYSDGPDPALYTREEIRERAAEAQLGIEAYREPLGSRVMRAKEVSKTTGALSRDQNERGTDGQIPVPDHARLK